MKGNYISLNRKILDWGWYNKPNTCRLFIHILLKANYKEKKWEDILIKRGTFITSTDKLAKELGLTRQIVRTALSNLTRTKEVTIITNRKYSLITVNKYDEYQIIDKDNQQITNRQPTDNQQITTTNNVNNINNVNNVVVGNIDIIYKDCLRDELWVEHLCMSTKKKKTEVVNTMGKFVSFLKDKGESSITTRKFKSTFSAFLRKHEDNKKKNRHDDLIM